MSVASHNASPRFVVLRHDSPDGLHWDFLLETDRGVLATWSLPRPPSQREPLPAEPLPDHRAFYLDHEGPVSGDRGTVAQWDKGTYRLESRTETRWSIVLNGRILQGRVLLERQPDGTWRFEPCRPE